MCQDFGRRRLARRLAAEAIGTAALLAIIVGSGVMGAELSSGNIAIALLANALATGLGLFVLITVLAPISGAHFNPVVSAMAFFDREIDRRTLLAYVGVQVGAAIGGTWLAHAMFEVQIFEWGTERRTGVGQWLSEIVATMGLVLVIRGNRCKRVELIAVAVGAYIAAAYWFTASTSFANPAVTIARSLTTTFAGIAPRDAPQFIAAQLVGAALAYTIARYLWPRDASKQQSKAESSALTDVRGVVMHSRSTGE
jgi:glycerol uptake facilitator-like aquaporin